MRKLKLRNLYCDLLHKILLKWHTKEGILDPQSLLSLYYTLVVSQSQKDSFKLANDAVLGCSFVCRLPYGKVRRLGVRGFTVLAAALLQVVGRWPGI